MMNQYRKIGHITTESQEQFEILRDMFAVYHNYHEMKGKSQPYAIAAAIAETYETYVTPAAPAGTTYRWYACAEKFLGVEFLAPR